MNKLNFVILLFIFAFCFQSVRSQRCNGNISFSLIDKKGKPILNNQVEIKEKPEPVGPSQIYYDSDKPTENKTAFSLGCSSGGVVSVIYKGAEMKINFKFYMEAEAEGKITFQKGYFIAEPKDREFGRARTGIQIRKAKDEELK
jgi:hypothetical protein